jgi:hypothetical protein
MAERGTPVHDSLPAAHFARGLGVHRDHWNLHLEELDQAVLYGSPEPARSAVLFYWPFLPTCPVWPCLAAGFRGIGRVDSLLPCWMARYHGVIRD